MNTEFFAHLTMAARHMSLAGEALVPARTRAHLQVIRDEACALITELCEPPAKPGPDVSPDSPRTGSRRITIEED